MVDHKARSVGAPIETKTDNRTFGKFVKLRRLNDVYDMKERFVMQILD